MFVLQYNKDMFETLYVMVRLTFAAENQCRTVPFDYGRATLTFGNYAGDRTSGWAAGWAAGLAVRGGFGGGACTSNHPSI